VQRIPQEVLADKLKALRKDLDLQDPKRHGALIFLVYTRARK